MKSCHHKRHDEILSPQREASRALVSIMPQGYDRLLSPQELADLVASDLHHDNAVLRHVAGVVARPHQRTRGDFLKPHALCQ